MQAAKLGIHVVNICLQSICALSFSIIKMTTATRISIQYSHSHLDKYVYNTIIILTYLPCPKVLTDLTL